MTAPLTCLSCAHHRSDGCVQRLGGWPTVWLQSCFAGCYEPGADEAENLDPPGDPA
jgi:hypothetical protein